MIVHQITYPKASDRGSAHEWSLLGIVTSHRDCHFSDALATGRPFAMVTVESNEKHWLPRFPITTPNGVISCSVFPQPTSLSLFLDAQNCVFGRLGDKKLQNSLRGNLDTFSGGRIASLASLPICEHQLAQSGNGECVLGILVRQGHKSFQCLRRLLLADSRCFRQRCYDFRLG